jgi:hypothetical protein
MQILKISLKIRGNPPFPPKHPPAEHPREARRIFPPKKRTFVRFPFLA